MDNKKIFFLIKNIHDKFDARGNTDCKSAGLTISQFRVLVYLEEHSDKIVTQKELETIFKVSHPTINGIINRLEAKNFIETKMIKEAGKQQKQIFFAQKGQDALKNMKTNRINDDKTIDSNFTDEEKEQFTEYLERLFKSLE